MAIKIDKTDEKPLLARKEIKGSMIFEGKATPSNDEVRKAIASELKVDEGVVVVKHIYTSFGSSEAEISAYVYNTKEDLEKIEPKQKKKGEKKPEGEAPAEGAAPEEKKEAAPSPTEKPEEKKEEVKEEKKEEKAEEKKEEEKK